MKTKHILFSLILISFLSCINKEKEMKKDYVLISDGGISVEKFDSTNVNKNRFTKNNETFSEATVFIYDYKHIAPKGNELLFTWKDINKDNPQSWSSAWKFVPVDSIDENTIKKVKLTVKPGLEPMIQHIPDYSQTIIQYQYLTKSGNAPFQSSSGVIENEANIWMHPPRDRYFQILELNPFPFIKAPYKIGNKWTWNLGIGDNWSDKRWKTWEGSIENKYKYEIMGKTELKTPFGKIKCFVIKSTATSRIGQTKLTSYFNPQYGFVKLDYTNIDGSKTT